MKTPKIDISKLLKQLDSFGEDGKRYAVAVTDMTARDISTKAQSRSPVDLGQLRQSIGYTKPTIQINRSLIYANAPYAAYVNFGTGGLVYIPKGFEELAAQFKGKGIRQINLPARPFLTSSYIEEAAEYPKRLNSAIQKLTKEYNNKK